MQSFDLRRGEELVEVRGLDGASRILVIREMSGDQRDTYMSRMAKRVTVERGVITGVSAEVISEMQGLLLGHCVYDRVTDAPVHYSEIQSYPARVLKAMFKIASDLNGLTDEGAAAAKND